MKGSRNALMTSHSAGPVISSDFSDLMRLNRSGAHPIGRQIPVFPTTGILNTRYSHPSGDLPMPYVFLKTSSNNLICPAFSFYYTFDIANRRFLSESWPHSSRVSLTILREKRSLASPSSV